MKPSETKAKMNQGQVPGGRKGGALRMALLAAIAAIAAVGALLLPQPAQANFNNYGGNECTNCHRYGPDHGDQCRDGLLPRPRRRRGQRPLQLHGGGRQLLRDGLVRQQHHGGRGHLRGLHRRAAGADLGRRRRRQGDGEQPDRHRLRRQLEQQLGRRLRQQPGLAVPVHRFDPAQSERGGHRNGLRRPLQCRLDGDHLQRRQRCQWRRQVQRPRPVAADGRRLHGQRAGRDDAGELHHQHHRHRPHRQRHPRQRRVPDHHHRHRRRRHHAADLRRFDRRRRTRPRAGR